MTCPEALLDPPSAEPSFCQRELPPVSFASEFAAEEIREELHRIIASKDFPATPRNQRFLSYTVERTLRNDPSAGKVTAFEIATKIFGRRDNFNQVEDPIVRIEAARLRKDLQTYYLKSGRRSTLRIDIPRGGYHAVFARHADREEIVPEARPVTGVLREDGMAQLRRIIASRDFPATKRNRQFLSYVVEKELARVPEEISARFIGVRVFTRGSSFDPNKDPIVRIEAGKLRRDLEIYYLTAGQYDPLHISVPKGRYRPVFAYRDLTVSSNG
jgi:hypothetical protein